MTCPFFSQGNTAGRDQKQPFLKRLPFLRLGHGRRRCWSQEHLAVTPWRPWPPRKESSPPWPWATLSQLTSKPFTTARRGTALALTQRSFALRNKVGAKVRQVHLPLLWCGSERERAKPFTSSLKWPFSAFHHCCPFITGWLMFSSIIVIITAIR